MSLEERAAEIAKFLDRYEPECLAHLRKGFVYHHDAINAEFRRVNPKTDEELLDWYRQTEGYIWELSAYHEDPGFNYIGMCAGISGRLQSEGMKKVLCLGDGIGDLSLVLHQGRLQPWYHDLWGSLTASFAMYRFWSRECHIDCDTTRGWEPEFVGGPYDAVASLDFLEHVTDVERWVRGIRDVLRPGGLFVAQNAFGIGSGPAGSIPCHLERNDRFERDWDPLLMRMGFLQESSNWYRR